MPYSDRIATRLIDTYGEPGRHAAARLRTWLAGGVPYAEPDVLARHLHEEHLPLVCDAFRQTLPFGTGGRRGLVGYGPNRMNPTTLAMTVQGHCAYLRAAWPDRAELTVVVANDTREFHDVAGTYAFLGGTHPLLGLSSRGLAKLACEIYAGNGVTAYLVEPDDDAAVLTTPELSFLIPEMGAAGGLNLTASHNPPDDNGVKVYDHTGSQPVAPDDQRLADIMSEAADIRVMPFIEARTRGLIRAIPATLHDAYLDTVLKCVAPQPRSAAPVVFTPLCGAALTTAGAALRRAGVPVLVPPGHGPDGTFAAIPMRTPNPERPRATESARAFAEERDIGLVLSSDPDGDRIGCEVRVAEDTWEHLTGNQIAAILCYFLLCDLDGPRRTGGVLTTIVTTRLLGAIVARRNAPPRTDGSDAGEPAWIVNDLLVGIKHIAAAIGTLERIGRYKQVSGRPADVVFAAEESHGVMLTPRVREKDAAPAGLLLAALAARLREQGHSLLDYYGAVLDDVGAHADAARAIVLPGTRGAADRNRLMTSLRDEPPRHVAGQPVTRIVDYWDVECFGPFLSETDRRARNLLCFQTSAGTFVVRPSGTEPTLKLYCQAAPPAPTPSLRGLALFRRVQRSVEVLADRVHEEVVARLETPLPRTG